MRSVKSTVSAHRYQLFDKMPDKQMTARKLFQAQQHSFWSSRTKISHLNKHTANHEVQRETKIQNQTKSFIRFRQNPGRETYSEWQKSLENMTATATAKREMNGERWRGDWSREEKPWCFSLVWEPPTTFG